MYNSSRVTSSGRFRLTCAKNVPLQHRPHSAQPARLQSGWVVVIIFIRYTYRAVFFIFFIFVPHYDCRLCTSISLVVAIFGFFFFFDVASLIRNPERFLCDPTQGSISMCGPGLSCVGCDWSRGFFLHLIQHFSGSTRSTHCCVAPHWKV